MILKEAAIREAQLISTQVEKELSFYLKALPEAERLKLLLEKHTLILLQEYTLTHRLKNRFKQLIIRLDLHTNGFFVYLFDNDEKR